MPVLALVLFTVFAALGFGWRSWQQRRHTGSTGFRGITGRADHKAFLAAIAGHVLARGVLTGTYER